MEKENNMARNTNAKAEETVKDEANAEATGTETKPKRKVRSLEERIAELTAKAEAKDAKAKEKAVGELEQVEDQLKKAHDRLLTLTERRTQLRRVLGYTDDESGTPEAGESATDSISEAQVS